MILKSGLARSWWRQEVGHMAVGGSLTQLTYARDAFN